MAVRSLHILNGDSLAEGVRNLSLDGDVHIWREILCVGPVSAEIGGQRFYDNRSQFLNAFLNISKESYHDAFISPLDKINALKSYSEITLWFEYDLFCHLNLLGALAWISQHGFENKVYHVCSGRVKGHKELVGLSELSSEELADHYLNRKLLTGADLEFAHQIWHLYNEENHNAIIEKIRQENSFDYLSNCLKSHIERFPSSDTGLNLLETHILKLIDLHEIKSEHQLCGYALSRQGYYGYGDVQILRIIGNLKAFYTIKNDLFALNDAGRKVLNREINVGAQMENDLYFGGARKYDWNYDATANKLVKRTP